MSIEISGRKGEYPRKERHNQGKKLKKISFVNNGIASCIKQISKVVVFFYM